MALPMMATGNRMQRDPIPNIRAAGRVIAMGNDGTEVCIKPDHVNQDRAPTPEHLQRYRKSVQNQPGVRQVHPGVYHDKIPVGDGHSYGKVTTGSDHVNGVIKAQNMAGLAERFNDIKEAKYASMQKEPLAKGYERGYNWPGQTKQDAFKFGVPTLNSENAKTVMYPMGGEKEEKNDVAKMYTKTHGNFGAGQQRDRDYNWPVERTQHRFGYGEQKVLNGAAMAVNSERIDEGFPKTVIVQKTVEDQKAVANDQLGKPKNLGQGKPMNVNDDHIFGVKNVSGNGVWNAANCIHGDPVDHRELNADRDLGTCTKTGCRNVVRRPEDNGRVFGVPTIRTDIPYKEKRSVADHQNYGDESEAVDILFPNTFMELGITEFDFQVPRAREEIKKLFENIGYNYKIGKFNTMYNRARTYMGQEGQGDLVNVRCFMQAVQELHHIE